MAETLDPCPFCGAAGKMIHPMGVYVGQGRGPNGGAYGPNGSRIVCTSPADVCCAYTASFHGPNQDADAIAAWNRRAPPVARPLDEWCEAIGNVLWWDFPVAEPPYCGTPFDMDFPDYKTHWTPIGPMPVEPKAEA